MKLFISKEVFKDIGKTVKLRPLDLYRTQINILNVFQKEDGSKETTPFNFTVPVSNVVLEKSKGNILIDIYGLVTTHKNEKNIELQKDNLIYAILYQGRMSPAEIYIPIEAKDKIEVLYRIQNKEDIFYLICLNLTTGESLPIYLAYEADFQVEKILLFDCSDNNELDVKEFNTYFYINEKNRILYHTLSTLKRKVIE